MEKKLLLALFILIGSLQFIIGQEATVSYSNYIESVEEYINRNDLTRKEARGIFKNVKNLALQNDPDALCMLGVLHKDGVGTPLNFNKARKYFELAHKQGDQKAAYSLGYLYLKVLGNIEQDYTKALKWFSVSDYPMAKHWIAKMHYLGLGIPQNEEKAIALLKENSSYNSRAFLWDIENRKEKEEIAISSSEFQLDTLEVTVNNRVNHISQPNATRSIPPDVVTGKWEGLLIEMDWSGDKIMRSIPVSFAIGKLQDGFGTLDTQIKIDSISTSGEALWNNGTLTFLDSKIKIEKQYTDHLDYPMLDYDLLSLSFEEQLIGETTYLLGKLESQIIQWSEPAPPMVLVLTKGEPELSAEILEALADQEDHFVKVYPNPFVTDLLVYYELEKEAKVTISIYDYYGQTGTKTYPQGYQKAGKQVFSLNNLSLKVGLHVVKITVDDTSYSKIVVKK